MPSIPHAGKGDMQYVYDDKAGITVSTRASELTDGEIDGGWAFSQVVDDVS
jgi:hypothetical protein